MCPMKTCLKIGCQNVQGSLISKCEEPDFVELVKNHDIFIVTETWLSDVDQSCTISGYEYVRSDRKKKKSSKRGSGGVLAYYKHSLKTGITKFTSKCSDLMWIKLNKQFFGLEQDWYLCCAYVVPKNSSLVNKATLQHLEVLSQEIAFYQSKGGILIMGDLNCRMGQYQENINLAPYDINDESLHKDEIMDLPTRRCMDSSINQQGRDFKKVINSSHLIILNGRVVGDMSGMYTCHTYNGSFVVDYCMVTPDIYKHVQYFKILPMEWYSDHTPITASFRIKSTSTNHDQNSNYDVNIENFPPKFKWSDTSKKKFADILNSEEYTKNFENYVSKTYGDYNKATDELRLMFVEAAKKCFKDDSNRHHKKIRKDRPNFSPIIQQAKRQFKQARRAYNNFICGDRRKELINARKKYKKAINDVKKCYEGKENTKTCIIG